MTTLHDLLVARGAHSTGNEMAWLVARLDQITALVGAEGYGVEGFWVHAAPATATVLAAQAKIAGTSFPTAVYRLGDHNVVLDVAELDTDVVTIDCLTNEDTVNWALASLPGLVFDGPRPETETEVRFTLQFHDHYPAAEARTVAAAVVAGPLVARD